MRGVLCNPKITMATRTRVLQCYVLPILKYACESWTISKEMEKRINASEMWFFRRMLRISWTSHTSNEDVLIRANTERKLLPMIRTHQLKFLGHCLRKAGIERLTLTGKIAGKRARGRQRMTYLRRIAKWSGKSTLELIKYSQNR